MTFTRSGETFYTQLLDQDIIVIDLERVAHDLLGRRSYNYSSRSASLFRDEKSALCDSSPSVGLPFNY